ncbi:triose-phosphate isomerase [Thalassoroseus pseudoceratinae]|uniref:triose-phosphate isomerase n=1 Tax=Thalassoroseus pseudoceratinae TaxID=2713176 RepID=UPI0014228FC8
MRRLFVAGNWKMNTTKESGVALAKEVAAAVPSGGSVDVMVAPPFPYSSAIHEAIAGSGVELGAQNLWYEPSGAFTGEVSADMLKDVGCAQVILGHSERRHVLGESDEVINKKNHRGLEAGLHVVFCVGEQLDDRDGGRTDAVLSTQLEGGLTGVEGGQFANLTVAYEPVWAIGTGRTASPEQAEAAHAHIRGWLREHYGAEIADSTRILYGGSVKPDNAAELIGQDNVDGALVGGASLKADQFIAIIQAAQGLS